MPKTLSQMLAEQAAKVAKNDEGLGSHLLINARAGTGKTFSVIEGVKRILGTPSNVVGSAQQETIWEAMEEGSKPGSICFVSFNRAIAQELAKRVPIGSESSTLHAFGRSICQKAYKLGKDDVKGYKTELLLEDYLGVDIWDYRKKNSLFVNAVSRLVSLCKLTLTEPDEESLLGLAARYEVDLDKPQKIFETVPVILEKAQTKTDLIDFDDMLWLPIVNNLLQKPIYDLLLVDESQDLNPCQQQFVLKAGKRLVLVGDPKQAIYGFAGADTRSMERMKETLAETPRGVKEFPLTKTRRCGKAIVELAKTLVPDFEAYIKNPPGEIKTILDSEITDNLRDTDMVVCRMNGPLIQLAFKLLKQERKVTIQGRDFGDNLVKFIKGLNAESVVDLVAKVESFTQREVEKQNRRKFPSENAIIALTDRQETIICLTEGAISVQDILNKIDKIFSDASGEGIKLSSIHKSKGLEARRVFIISPEMLPHPMAKSAESKEQELNLKYVAITRAIYELIWVTSSGSVGVHRGMKQETLQDVAQPEE